MQDQAEEKNKVTQLCTHLIRHLDSMVDDIKSLTNKIVSLKNALNDVYNTVKEEKID